jgi:hypothetical protein
VEDRAGDVVAELRQLGGRQLLTALPLGTLVENVGPPPPLLPHPAPSIATTATETKIRPRM